MAFDMKIVVCLLFLVVVKVRAGYSDISCLKSIKESLEDPENVLSSSWNFDNQTEGAVCRFTGVECWNPRESRVLSINLSNMGLVGSFPTSLSNCTSLIVLNLSNNKLSGPLPSNMSNVCSYIVNLDLSSNEFSGEIPADFANCVYLNILNLGGNKLEGGIPAELAGLKRLKYFSVANNHLSGPVPDFTEATSVTKDSYANNTGLCGGPLPPCVEHRDGLMEILE